MRSLLSGPWHSRRSSRRQRPGDRFRHAELLEPRLVLDGSGFLTADPVAQPALSITAEAITPPSTSYLPGEAFNALKFAPNGQLSMVLWNNNVLEFRVRNGSGQWGVEKITDNIYTGDGFGVGANQPYRDKEQAQLLFSSDGTPQVLMLTPEGVAHFVRDPIVGWLKLETIPLPGNTNNSFNPLYENLQAAVGPGGVLHFMAIFNRYEANGFQNPADGSTIYYGTNLSGSWSVTEAANLPDAPNRYHPLRDVLAPRTFSMAVDSQNRVHAVIGSHFVEIPVTGGVRLLSELDYITNRGGSFHTEVVIGPSDDSSDAGYGASIAIGPNDVVAVAHTYEERVTTGSSQFSQLLYSVRQANGTWPHEVVASSPDGYVGGDGPYFTGFSPHLVFDENGVPNIAFLDIASSHYPNVNNIDFAGNLRHAWKPGASWQLETVFRQTNPEFQVAYYPVITVSQFEIAYAVVTQEDIPNGSGGYNTAFNTILVHEQIQGDPRPVLSNGRHGAFVYLQGHAPVKFFPGVVLNDPRSIGYSGAQILVRLTTNYSSSDQLSLVGAGQDGPGLLNVVGTEVRFSGAVIGSVSGGAGGNALIVTFNANADLAGITTALRAIAFHTSVGQGNLNRRNAELVFRERDNITSLPLVQFVDVAPLSQTSDSLRFLRLYNPNADVHVYTTDQGEFNALIAAGLRDEATGNIGLLVNNAYTVGTLPLHRLYNPNNGLHYYTFRDAERDFLTVAGWYYEKDEGYVYPDQAPGTKEVFLLYNDNSGEHLYLTDVNEKNAILATFPSWHQHTSLGFTREYIPSGNALPAGAGVVMAPAAASASGSGDDAASTSTSVATLIALPVAAPAFSAAPTVTPATDNPAPLPVPPVSEADREVDELFSGLASSFELDW